MITKMSIDNVRLFRGGDWSFPIAPLTVFCGTNSAGKSTLLKVLLLLRQNVVVPESYSETEGTIRFVSSLADLGSYAAFVSDNEVGKDIQISLTIEDVLSEGQIEELRAISRGESHQKRNQKTKWLPYSLQCVFVLGTEKQAFATEATSPTPVSQASLKEARFKVVHSDETLLEWRVVSTLGKTGEEKNVKRYELLVPESFATSSMPYLSSLGEDPATKLVRFQASVPGILPDRVRAQWVSKRKKSTERPSLWSLPPQLNFLITDFRSAIRNIHYLGPLRTPAKRYYIANLDDSLNLDSTGEFLPAILHKKGEAKVLGIPNRSELDTLEKGLNYWLHYLRTGNKVETADALDEIRLSTTKDVLVELLLKTPSGVGSHALADSGFGYSQVLPILVTGLLAKPNSTLIIEQPELHLNPALQVRLAGFFIELVRKDKQVLIETHSEHLVNALRVLTAEDESEQLAKNIEIFFMEMKSSDPIVHRLTVQPDGTVPEWPAAFFGEALSLSTRLLKAQKRFLLKPPSESPAD